MRRTPTLCGATSLGLYSARKVNTQVHEPRPTANRCFDVGHVPSLDEKVEAFSASRRRLTDHPLQGGISEMRLKDPDPEEA
jgi:hypothetical protein